MIIIIISIIIIIAVSITIGHYYCAIVNARIHDLCATSRHLVSTSIIAVILCWS